MRHKIQSATNTSEAWNGFIQWVAFGGDKLRKADRSDQKKIILYNHLVSNLIVLYNTVHLTKSLNVFALQKKPIDLESLRHISPYRPGNINRFGKYEIQEGNAGLDFENLNLHLNIR